MRVHGWTILAVALLASSLAAGYEQKGEQKTGGSQPVKGAKSTDEATLTSEQETAVLRFVRENHAALAELLSQLKTSNHTQYDQAMRDLFKATTTLAETQKRDPKKYELDLRAWQVNSQIQVLVARMTMSPNPMLEEELKAKVVEQIDIRLQHQELERERVTNRLEKLDATIAKTRQDREQEAQKTFDRLVRGAVKSRPDAKPGKKPTPSDHKPTESTGTQPKKPNSPLKY